MPTLHSSSAGKEGFIRICRLITSSGLLLWQKLWVTKRFADHKLTYPQRESYPLPIMLFSKDFDPVIIEKQNVSEEEEKSVRIMSSLAKQKSSEAEPK